MSVLDGPFAVMGIVNVTPDSFFDGGRYSSTRAAVDHGLAMAAQGAAVLDIGGESSRPGAAPVSADEECRRVLPVIEELAAKTKTVISIDTSKSAVAARALAAGASWINDISAGRFDPGMAQCAAQHRCPVVLMHSRRTPADMQTEPHYDDVVAEVSAELLRSVELFVAAGVIKENIILDPGIGFAKRLEDNVRLLREIRSLLSLGYPLLVGTSRKSFIGRITGKEPDGRLGGSLGSVAAAFAGGARLFRVHDVGETVDMLKVMSAIATGQ
jgi:dihydropteroate synthase